jgi:hypothetical protein
MESLTIINKMSNFINVEQVEYNGNLIILPDSSESINSIRSCEDLFKDKKINIEVKKYSQINDVYEGLFVDKFNTFKRIDYEYKNKKNSFLKSLFTIIDPSFYYLNERDFDLYIGKIMSPIGYEIEEKSLIKKFNLNYKINKTLIENIFITFNENLDINDDFNIFMQFFCLYFNINLIIIEFDKAKLNNFNVLKVNGQENCNLYGIIEKNNGFYYPILSLTDDNDITRLFDNINYENIINNINKFIESHRQKVKKPHKINIVKKDNEIQKEDDVKKDNEIQKDESKLNDLKNKIQKGKFKLNELQEIAEKYCVSIKKKSDKTNKMVNKTIKELEDDILQML